MNEVNVILLSTVLPIFISGVITIAGIILQAYLTRKHNNEDIKFELLSKINNEILESYDMLLKNNNEIPNSNASQNKINNFFTDNLILVYQACKEDFKNLSNIFNKSKIVLREKDNIELKNEFQRLHKLEFNLFASALSNSLGGTDSLIEKGIVINDEIDFISNDEYNSSIRGYIDSVAALKEKLTTILGNYMKELLK